MQSLAATYGLVADGLSRGGSKTSMTHMGVSQTWGYLIGGPHNKDYRILGSTWGSPYFGKLPYKDHRISSSDQT